VLAIVEQLLVAGALTHPIVDHSSQPIRALTFAGRSFLPPVHVLYTIHPIRNVVQLLRIECWDDAVVID
jgi:hypothetical protein